MKFGQRVERHAVGRDGEGTATPRHEDEHQVARFGASGSFEERLSCRAGRLAGGGVRAGEAREVRTWVTRRIPLGGDDDPLDGHADILVVTFGLERHRVRGLAERKEDDASSARWVGQRAAEHDGGLHGMNGRLVGTLEQVPESWGWETLRGGCHVR